jgi:hypothetical protein
MIPALCPGQNGLLGVSLGWVPFLRRLRRVQTRLAIFGASDVAFPLSVQGRHAKVRISELNGWPASPLTDATLTMSPPPAYSSRPELLAKFSL